MKHPKTKRLVRALHISLAQAIGHLHIFWWWAVDYAGDGDVSQYGAADIADASMWEGNADEFYDALLESGYLEQKGDRILIHDWLDYAGKFVKKRRQNKERKQRARGLVEENDDASRVTHRDVSVTGGGYSNQKKRKNKRLKDSLSSLSQTEGERENLMDQNTGQVNVMADEFGGPSPDVFGGRKRITTVDYSAEFDRFWSIYPRKVEKQAAFRCWKTRLTEWIDNDSPVTADMLTRCAVHYAEECKQIGTPLKFIKHGSTFLGPNRPFLDYIDGQPEPITQGNRNAGTILSAMDELGIDIEKVRGMHSER